MRQAGVVTAERWTQVVRQQLGLGRILPLGEARDGAWIAERAVAEVLRHAVARDAPGVRLGGLRIGPVDPVGADEPVVPPPPSALPPGPLRVTAEFAATAQRPLTVTASGLRAVLADVAARRIGLVVAEVDLRVTELLDVQPPVPSEPLVPSGSPPVAAAREPAPGGWRTGDWETGGAETRGAVGPEEGGRESGDFAAGDAEAGGSDVGRVAAAVLAVPGVTRLTGVLGRPVHLTSLPGTVALPRRHARVDFAVDADARPREVARAVRSAVSASLPDHPTVTALITAVDRPTGRDTGTGVVTAG
ncbi:nucleopolyhedrovirus P10 family protein [Streptomyces calvus]|uniref:nucleopolyhedrovirus P10 family protein n=1 Tax=Streptomyces calvus TaxID=67282 RepID=UPI0037180221